MNKPQRLINIHGHLHPGDDVDALVREWDDYGVTHFCCQCLGGPFAQDNGGDYLTADDLLPWMRKYPHKILGFANPSLSSKLSPAWEIEKRKEQGFTGLKFMLPALPYDDERYFHLYEAAEKLGMPILFHTGYVSNPRETGRFPDIDSSRMRPGRFDRIARAFPDLHIIGAHLGYPFFEEAKAMAWFHPNVYFDISGGSGQKPHLSNLKRGLAPFPGANWDDPDENLSIRLFEKKILFATDNPPSAVWIQASLEILDYLHIPEAAREGFWWKNAAGILGIPA
jgi:predicted TIM-barrel fold metal-dependent hydrolase